MLCFSPLTKTKFHNLTLPQRCQRILQGLGLLYYIYVYFFLIFFKFIYSLWVLKNMHIYIILAALICLACCRYIYMLKGCVTLVIFESKKKNKRNYKLLKTNCVNVNCANYRKSIRAAYHYNSLKKQMWINLHLHTYIHICMCM